MDLPSDDNSTYENEMATIAGWGDDNGGMRIIVFLKISKKYNQRLFSELGFSPALKYIESPIISNDACNKIYEDYYDERPGPINSTNLCTSTEGGKSCTYIFKYITQPSWI